MVLEEVLFFQRKISVEELSWRNIDRNIPLLERAQRELTELKDQTPFWLAHLKPYSRFSAVLEGNGTIGAKIANYNQLFYLYEGEATILTPNKDLSGSNKEYRLTSGCMVLVPAGIAHKVVIANYAVLMTAAEQKRNRNC